MTEHVTIVDHGPIRWVRMNRLNKKNAISEHMYDKLAGALDDAAHRKSIHCVAIMGGKDVFSAGSDLNDFLHAAQHVEDCNRRLVVSCADWSIRRSQWSPGARALQSASA